MCKGAEIKLCAPAFCGMQKIQVTKEQLEKFFKDPEIVTLELLFVSFTLCSVLIVWGVVSWVWPFPVILTWAQLLTSFTLAWIFGEAGRTFPKSAFFPPLAMSWDVIIPLLLPIASYIAMMTLSNYILADIPSIASYPAAVSMAVVLHHVTRFFGCGQVYMPIRWIGILAIAIGFLIAGFDIKSVGPVVLPIAFAYAVASASYRACFLERAMHVVEGNGNVLHNNQVIVGIVVLPIVAAIQGEFKGVFSNNMIMDDPSKLFTWQVWGCLISAGILPFLKNIVANRLIRRSGQAPWRFLELVSLLGVFVIGASVAPHPVTPAAIIAFCFVIFGRALGSYDALTREPLAVRQKAEREADVERHLEETAEAHHDREQKRKPAAFEDEKEYQLLPPSPRYQRFLL